MGLIGQTVVITGASRGIGAETAKVFSKAGANVVLLARGSEDLNRLADQLGFQALAVNCDVSETAQVHDAIDAAHEKFGSLNILINNAGVVQPIERIDQSDPTSWGKAIDINLKGVYYATRAVLPIMLSAGTGTILNVSSGAANSPFEASSHYCAAKAGAAMLTQCTDLEYRHLGIRALGLSPGTVATQMQRELKASGINPVSKLNWSDHISPTWPARALLWMCSSDADEFLGQDISLRDQAIRKRVGLVDD